MFYLNFFVSEFTLVLELFEHNFVDFHLIWEVGGKVGGSHPFLVFEFILVPELYVQNFVVVHTFLFVNRFCPFSIPNKPYVRQIFVPNFVPYPAFNRRTDIARSTQNQTRIQKIYTLWGLR